MRIGRFTLRLAIASLAIGWPLALSAQVAGLVDSAARVSGSIEGVLVVGSKPVAGISVMVRESGQSAVTDKYGVYRFSNVTPGTYTLVATAEGYQKLHITDVVVKPNGSMTLSQVQMHRPVDGVVALEPYVVKGEANNTIELDKYLVEGARAKPFQDANVDIPRTVNDAQPYYIFDSKTIDQSGAVDIQDFLKKRLTMNTIGITASQRVTSPGSGAGNASNGGNAIGNTSAVDLRGLGSDATLVLVNGRRMAGAVLNNVANQPDLNGIPLGAVDRIEILPSSASAIYGASALGGVVNVVLKKNYSGGEVRLSYDTPFDTDAPRQSASLSFGTGFNDGKTRIMLTASWTKETPLYLADRRELFQRNLDAIVKNFPTFLFSSSSPFLGALPNVASQDGAPLIFLDGTPLGSNATYVPAGTSPTTSAATLKAGLITNAGKWDLTLPPTAQNPTGLFRPLAVIPVTRSYAATLTQELWPTVTVSIEAMHNENNSALVNHPWTLRGVAAGNPYNPFTTAVVIATPTAFTTPSYTSVTTDQFVISTIAKLPKDWTIQGDYSWSSTKTLRRSVFALVYPDLDPSKERASQQNWFIDTLSYPADGIITLYESGDQKAQSYVDDFAFRGSGPLFFVPWVEPGLTIGLEHRIATLPENTSAVLVTIPPTLQTFFRRQQETTSAYTEFLVPLLRPNRIPFVHQLELQLSGRIERFKVDNGTSSRRQNLTTGAVTFTGTTLNGQPYFSKATYASTNKTIGLKYQPIPEITMRASFGTAFLPPSPDLLLKNPVPPSATLTTIIDPQKGQSYGVQTVSGGNPDLKPQNSRSYNAGVIWQPTTALLKGLRLNLEYYKIMQSDAFGSLSAQQIINEEAVLSDRVTRNSAGFITLVDTSFLNLFIKETEGWDLTLGYDYKTAVGLFSLNAQESTILSLKSQISKTLPILDSVGFPSEGGAPKRKAALALNWQYRGWTAGWATRFTSKYNQSGSEGGPLYTRLAGATSVTDKRFINAQGSTTIPGQSYHDAFVSYKFGGPSVKDAPLGDRLLSNLTVQLAVNNVFNAASPLDTFYDLYLSPFGDTRLRSYRVSIKKEF